MYKMLCLFVIVLILAAAVACTPSVAPAAQPSLTSAPTETTAPPPTETPLPEPTAFPTAIEPAPEQTFTEVGNVAELSGPHNLSGRAVVAGLQTLIIQGFTFDGKGPQVDIRLVKGTDYQNPAAILLTLEPRVYEQEMLLMTIPSSVTPENADRIAIYCPDSGEAYITATFE